MTGRDPVQLSIQELINCVNEDPDSDREDDHGCYTSSISRAFKWIRQNGILREDECPFVGERQPCAPKLEVSPSPSPYSISVGQFSIRYY